MSNLDDRLRALGRASQLRRTSPNRALAESAHTYTYDGYRLGRHWVRRGDGTTFAGKLITNGAIAIGDRVRFANRQIDAMPHLVRTPQLEPKPLTTTPFEGEVMVIFVVP